MLGLSSSGCHSNGFSLIRRCVEESKLKYQDFCPWNIKRTLGDELLEPTKVYVKALMPLLKAGLIKGLSHITGGGLIDNIPRAIPEHLCANLDATLWPLPPVFRWLKTAGNLDIHDMCRTFNMGIGMVLIVNEQDVLSVQQSLEANDMGMVRIGRLEEPISETRCKITNIEIWE